jgi:hypothetical protein
MTNTITIGPKRIPLCGLTHGDLPNDCWLDGKEAVIGWPQESSGYQFAMVRQLSTGIGCEWPIDAARRVFAKDRKFTS